MYAERCLHAAAIEPHVDTAMAVVAATSADVVFATAIVITNVSAVVVQLLIFLLLYW